MIIKYHPFCLPWEFTIVIACTVYILLHTDLDTALCELHKALKHFTRMLHSLSWEIVTKSISDAHFTTFTNTSPALLRGSSTLDHCSTPFKYCYRSQPLAASGSQAIPPFSLCLFKNKGLSRKYQSQGRSHTGRTNPQPRCVFDDVLYDWDMFRQNYDDIDMFKEAVVGLIGKLGVDTVEKNYHLNISKLEAMGGQKHL